MQNLFLLNGKIQEEVYVTQPKGFVEKGQEHLVYELIKAPRAWYAKLNMCVSKNLDL